MCVHCVVCVCLHLKFFLLLSISPECVCVCIVWCVCVSISNFPSSKFLSQKDFDYTKSGSIGLEEFVNMYHTLIYVRSVSGRHFISLDTCNLVFN